MQHVAKIVHLVHSPTEAELGVMRMLLGHAGLTLEHVVDWAAAEAVTHLATLQPTLVVVWEQYGHMLRALQGGRKAAIDDWAGYVWRATAVVPGTKCIATYAPSRLRMEWGLTGVVRFHLARAAREGGMKEVVVPERRIHHALSLETIIKQLCRIRDEKWKVAVDLEGGCGMGPACVGFAWSAHDALVVPFYDVDGVSLWSEAEEVLLWEVVASVLEDPRVPKIIQNGAYELFVLAWSVGIVVRGLADDTMLKQWELYCELEKSLEFQASLYTEQPHWKLDHKPMEGRYVPFKDGRRATTHEWLVYNGTDCCVTHEVNVVMDGMLRPQQRDHYLFNVSLLTPLAYMSLKGMPYDKEEAKARLAATRARIYELQDQINQTAATSEGRPALKAFYEACGVEHRQLGTGLPALGATNKAGEGQPLVGRSAAALVGMERQGVGEGLQPLQAEPLQGHSIQQLIPLLTAAFCGARRTEEREVEEVSWQPMQWVWTNKSKTKGRWSRAGKRTHLVQFCLQNEGKSILESDTEPQSSVMAKPDIWLKPHRKLVRRHIPVEVQTLEDVRRFALGSKQDDCKQALAILRGRGRGGEGALSSAARGELSTLLNLHINTESTSAGGDAQWYLYEHCGFERQHAKDGARKTDRLTTDTEALLKVWMRTRDPRVKLVLALRAALTACESLSAEVDEDGRIRASYNVVGTNTGRLSSSESPTGSGFNLQTVTKRDRCLFSADPGMELYSCDLSGADSWTVAAHAARLGDPTMMDDLLARLKPAKIIALMYLHGVAVNSKSREELRAMSKEVPDDGGLYPAAKATTHGSNYGMKESTMAANILRQSYKKTGTPIEVDPATCKRLQSYYFTRYPGVVRWQSDVASRLRENGTLTTPFGYIRRFFGRKDDNGTLRDALSFEPQANTTWATNMMLHSLWTDPENRRQDGTLIVEPLHQVHDATVFQAPVGMREWVKGKVHQWFRHPLLVGGVEVNIPYEGGVGASWGELEAL